MIRLDILVSANKEQDALLTPCWRCICEATSGCNTTIGCEQGFCGPFKLSWTYWKEAGKPTVKGDDPEAEEAYNNCVNDIYCAIVSVQRYTNKHAQVTFTFDFKFQNSLLLYSNEFYIILQYKVLRMFFFSIFRIATMITLSTATITLLSTN